jgi:hypothetical protein
MLKDAMAIVFLLAALLVQDSEVQVKPLGTNQYELTLDTPAGAADAAPAFARMRAATERVCQGKGVESQSTPIIAMDGKKPPRATITQEVTCK